MKRIIASLILVLTLVSPGYSCDCLWGGNFFELSKESTVIVKVKVVGYEKLEQDFNEILVCEVLKKYKGQDIRDTIKLQGDNGAFCAPYVSYFKIGGQYIIQYDQIENYTPWISNCGEYYLTIKGGSVNSEVDLYEGLSQIGVVTLEDFEKELQNPKHQIESKDNVLPPPIIEKKKSENRSKGNNQYLILIGVVVATIILFILIWKKRNANKT